MNLMMNKRFILIALAVIVSNLCFCLEPVMALRLNDMNLEKFQIGYFFILMPLAYSSGGFLGDTFTKQFDNRSVIASMLFCCGLSMFLSGPAVETTRDLVFMALGQFLIGYFVVQLTI